MTNDQQPIMDRPIQNLQIPDFALVALIGASGSGKSTFAARHFLPTEVLSSDAFRGWVSDDEGSIEATGDAFDALHYLAGIRLRRRKLVVVDATNVQPESRKPLVELAERHDALAVAIVLNVPEQVCHARNRARPERTFGSHVVRNHVRDLRRSLRGLKREGFRYIYTLETEADIANAQIQRVPLWTDRRGEHGPFDIVGDIHGCIDELRALLAQLGYVLETEEAPYRHPDGRRVIFLGDLVDRGPGVVETIRTVLPMVAAGSAFCVPGNHDVKLMRHLQGKSVAMTYGLPESVAQIERLPEEEREQLKRDFVRFVDGLVSHFVLDGARLVVAHAGMKEAYQGRASGRVRDFAIWGDTTGETDAFGLPVRYPWAEDYRGRAMVVYGHTPVPEAQWLNNTINLDTGCVFGGKLTALRYPERELVQVAARQTYATPAKPFLEEGVQAFRSSGVQAAEAREATPDKQAIIDDAVREMQANQIRNRERAVQAITAKNTLQAMVARQERLIADLAHKAVAAHDTGDESQLRQLLQEKASQEETLPDLHAKLAAALEAAEAIKKAIREEDERIRLKTADALRAVAERNAKAVEDSLSPEGATSPDPAARQAEETLHGEPPARPFLPEPSFVQAPQPDVQETPPSPEEMLYEAVREMRESHIRTRERAVQAITQQNHLHAMAQRLEQHIAELEHNLIAAQDAGNATLIQMIQQEKAAREQALMALRSSLAAAQETMEAVKEALRQDEAAIRAKTAEALRMKTGLKAASLLEEVKALEQEVLSALDAPPSHRAADMRSAESPTTVSLQWQADEILRAEDVLGKRAIETRLAGHITIRAENAAAALEVMSRFAVEPRWLLYLPPTMSPSETTHEPGYLEYPREAFAYYRNQGVPAVVCQTKHMGSRAVVVVCRDDEAARRRFGAQGVRGECYTRTGRRFFDDEALHRGFLEEVAGALTRAGFWEEFRTDWACLDGELMPWNAKAQGLLRDQYAPVGAAASLALSLAQEAVRAALNRTDGVGLGPEASTELAAMVDSLARRQEDVRRYVDAYAHYCWPVNSLADYRFAPFQLLATEGVTYFDRDHEWHVATLAKIAGHSGLLQPTESRTVDLLDEEAQGAATQWWIEYTESGGEGMVVKPREVIVKGPKGLAQPGVKVRGREYLRIIYGPEYTEPENLGRLRQRALHAKRSLAVREFALGVEGLERFVRGEPLRRIHECAFGVLALESEPVDPRL